MAEERHIYIILSQSGSLLSKLLGKVTHAQYNHASLSYDDTLRTMYSFGRRFAYNPFWGGYVRESTSHGTFKRFPKTTAIVLRVPVSEESYEGIRAELDAMYENKWKYGYNYIGLGAAKFDEIKEYKNRYYCSEFVRYILKKHGVVDENAFNGIVKPIDFLEIEGGEVIYEGKLKEFRNPSRVKAKA